MNQPELIVVGGPNGCGKTTFAREHATRTGMRYLGADDIAAQLLPAHPEQAAIPAARTFAAQLEETLAAGQSVIVESTLAGRSLRHTLLKAQAAGYRLTVLFGFLDSVELCLKRIAGRVARGGHDVPEADVRRRFKRSMENFWRVYRHSATRWILIYNAGESFQPVALGEADRILLLDETRFQQWLTMIE